MTLILTSGNSTFDMSNDEIKASIASSTKGVNVEDIVNLKVSVDSTRRRDLRAGGGGGRASGERALASTSMQVTVTFELILSVTFSNYTSASELVSVVGANIEESVASGTLTQALAETCGCDQIKVSDVDVVENLPTMSPTPKPTPKAQGPDEASSPLIFLIIVPSTACFFGLMLYGWRKWWGSEAAALRAQRRRRRRAAAGSGAYVEAEATEVGESVIVRSVPYGQYPAPQSDEESDEDTYNVAVVNGIEMHVRKPAGGPKASAMATKDSSDDEKEDPIFEEDCAVCFDKLVPPYGKIDKVVRVRGCQHLFHDKCIREWLKHSRRRNQLGTPTSCPMCRTPVRPRDLLTVKVKRPKTPNEPPPGRGGKPALKALKKKSQSQPPRALAAAAEASRLVELDAWDMAARGLPGRRPSRGVTTTARSLSNRPPPRPSEVVLQYPSTDEAVGRDRKSVV